MKDKNSKKLDEFKKMVETLKLKKENQVSEPNKVSVSNDNSKVDLTTINDFSKIYGEETYKKIMEKFKNIKK